MAAKKVVRRSPPRQNVGLTPLGVPSEFSKLGDIGQLMEAGWAKIPSYYYDFQSSCLPLTEDEFNTQFNSVRSVFGCTPDQCVDGQQTNASCGSGVNEAFLATGLCIIAFGEGEAFAQNGVAVDTPTAATGTPTVVTSTILDGGYEGVANLAVSVAGAQHAQLNWGSPTWRIIEKYFKNTRLQVNINRRFQVVDENLLDIGMCPLPPEFVGASDSKLGVNNFIRSVNAVLAAKDLGQQFLPANVMADPVGDTTTCIPPALSGVTYGHPRIVGLSNRIYCFPQPLLFVPGMRFDMNLVPVGCESLCDDLLATATMQCVTQSDLFTGSIAGFGDCGTVCTIPGGSISLGVVLKGFSLWPTACMQYILNFIMPGSMAATILGTEGSAYLQGLASKTHLAGVKGKWGTDALGTIGSPPQYRQGQQ